MSPLEIYRLQSLHSMISFLLMLMAQLLHMATSRKTERYSHGPGKKNSPICTNCVSVILAGLKTNLREHHYYIDPTQENTKV